MQAILGLVVVGAMLASVLGLAFRGQASFRAGPWPGLTARGAGVLLACAVMLGGCELVIGRTQRALPDLVWLTLVDLLPLLIATTVMRMPGSASAVCGVYLLERSLPSLVDPALEPPPLLLPSAIGFDLVAWVQPHDLKWHGVKKRWRRQEKLGRRFTRRRAAAAGAVFGVVLALVEPPFALLLGSDPAAWQTVDRLLAGGLAGVAGALVGAAIERVTNRVLRPP